jgi:hypothetical protein
MKARKGVSIRKTCGKPRVIDDVADEAIRDSWKNRKVQSMKQLRTFIEEQHALSLSRKRKTSSEDEEAATEDGTKSRMSRMSRKRYVDTWTNISV